MRATGLLTLVGLLLIGCAGGGNTSVSTSPAPTPPQGFPPTPITSGVVLEMYTATAGSVYDSTHKYLFVCVTKLDRVDVFSTMDYHLVSSIPTPSPTGIDISADDTHVVVGSYTPNFFLIDTGSLRVVRAVPVPPVGAGNPQIVVPTNLTQSSNGNILFIMKDIGDSGQMLAEWSPKSGQFTYPQFQSPQCITSSADHTKTLIGSTLEFALYDAASDSFTAQSNGYTCFGGIAANAQGTQFAIGAGSSVSVLDTNLNVLEQIPTGNTPSRNLGLTYGMSGRYLYLIGADFLCNQADLTVLDTTTSSVAGKPIVQVGGECNGSVQIPQPPPIDENNVLFIGIGGSVAVTPTPQTPIQITPGWHSIAPPAGFFQTSEALPVAGNLPQFGYAIRNGGPTSGGPQQQFYFYGEQYAAANLGSTIGGASANVEFALDANLFQTNLSLWLEVMIVKTPPGLEGLADVQIETPVGSTTIKNGFNFVKEQVVPVSGSLWQLLYDKTRQRLYMTNATANRVEVYSLASEQLLSPIPVGKTPHGLAMTPDGSLLVVANSGDGTVTIVNPDNPSGAATVLLGTVGGAQPNEVATTNTGKALLDYAGPLEIDLTSHLVTSVPDNRIYAVMSLTANKDGSAVVCDCGSLGLLNPKTSTWTFTTLNDSQAFNTAISGDGTAIAQGNYMLNPQLAVTGELAQWDFAPGTLSLSGNADVLNASGSLLYKVDFGGGTFATGVQETGVQVFDVNHGDIKEWISLAESVPNNSPNPHQLTLDDTGQNLYVLTQSGFTILNFPIVPLSVAYVTPNQAAAVGGTTITVRGSGFEPGCQTFFNGTSAITTFVDTQTLSVVTPQVSSGPVQLSIQNPDGQVYFLDDAFTAQ